MSRSDGWNSYINNSSWTDNGLEKLPVGLSQKQTGLKILTCTVSLCYRMMIELVKNVVVPKSNVTYREHEQQSNKGQV